jgi:transportin-3
VFECLRSWLRAGEIQTSTLIATPLFQLSFEALQSDELFDVAIDVLCDVINETQEVHDNMGAIELIVPRLLPLRADLAKAIEDGDDDKVRGLCRLFVAAGETYHQLILRHREQFFPIVEAIASCAAYAEIEIVQITFRFWWMLASGLGKARADPSIQPFLDVFERILSIVIRLLRWSDDVDTASASDVADQRELRHNLGDTLKDCCQVLGARECLTRSLQMIEELLAQASAAGASGAGPKWQDIEAPLFSMRAMGRVADMQDNDVTPRIMDIVSALPEHPKVKYAGLLVVCRYTEWVAAHPERIPPVLSYISSGLQGAHIEDTGAAAAQALNYLCQDCAHLLLPYLPQLYDFFHSVSGEALPNSDLMQVTEAIALVVAGIQGADERTSTALHFLQPLLQALQAFAASTESSSEAIGKATSKMEQLQVFLHALGRGRNLEEEPLPEACAKTCVDVYALLDRIIETRGSSVVVAERTCHLLRRGMAFFGDAARPVVPAMLSRLSDAFATSGHSCYIWIVGKCIDAYGPHADAQLQAAMLAAFERVSAKTLEQLEVTPAAEMSDSECGTGSGRLMRAG